MPITLKGSCRCGAVRFSVESHAPVPYQLCYCSICRKTAGGGGFAINLSAVAAPRCGAGGEARGRLKAPMRDGAGHCERSQAQRHFCARCGTALWLFDPRWPELLHPFASAIDSHLPRAPEKTHVMLRFKASWVEPAIGETDQSFEEYPEESIEEWHRKRGLWVE